MIDLPTNARFIQIFDYLVTAPGILTRTLTSGVRATSPTARRVGNSAPRSVHLCIAYISLLECQKAAENSRWEN